MKSTKFWYHSQGPRGEIPEVVVLAYAVVVMVVKVEVVHGGGDSGAWWCMVACGARWWCWIVGLRADGCGGGAS